MASKMVITNSQILSGIVVDAAMNVADELDENKFKIDIDYIKVSKFLKDLSGVREKRGNVVHPYVKFFTEEETKNQLLKIYEIIS